MRCRTSLLRVCAPTAKKIAALLRTDLYLTCSSELSTQLRSTACRYPGLPLSHQRQLPAHQARLSAIDSEANPNLRVCADRRRKSNSIQAVIDAHADTASDLNCLLQKPAQQRQGQEPVSDCGSIGRLTLCRNAGASRSMSLCTGDARRGDSMSGWKRSSPSARRSRTRRAGFSNSAIARSRSTWIHWRSSVASANCRMRSSVTGNQSVTASSRSTQSLKEWGVSRTSGTGVSSRFCRISIISISLYLSLQKKITHESCSRSSRVRDAGHDEHSAQHQARQQAH
jgi:hypothetical protein